MIQYTQDAYTIKDTKQSDYKKGYSFHEMFACLFTFWGFGSC